MKDYIHIFYELNRVAVLDRTTVGLTAKTLRAWLLVYLQFMFPQNRNAASNIFAWFTEKRPYYAAQHVRHTSRTQREL